AILLADRIIVMSNGPKARVAESVVVDIPRPRKRSTIIDDPGYYKIRNYLVDFLVNRSEELSGQSPQPNEYPVTVNPVAINPPGDAEQPIVIDQAPEKLAVPAA
ncbi:hypothetical protein OAG89_03450, partial [Pseudomonadales bacterium]|nr:hypothetical protein [Pseudomonadales bacterium]